MGQAKNRKNPDGTYKWINGTRYRDVQGFECLGEYVEMDEQEGRLKATGKPFLKASKKFKKKFYKG